ncbi:MAG: hypothetical protein E6R13_05660 [Spirochaetes bacterium]|nr:MAG: hypothetical protein E6R13_05660 [Spirochaetota bacterium]
MENNQNYIECIKHIKTYYHHLFNLDCMPWINEVEFFVEELSDKYSKRSIKRATRLLKTRNSMSVSAFLVNENYYDLIGKERGIKIDKMTKAKTVEFIVDNRNYDKLKKIKKILNNVLEENKL